MLKKTKVTKCRNLKIIISILQNFQGHISSMKHEQEQGATESTALRSLWNIYIYKEQPHPRPQGSGSSRHFMCTNTFPCQEVNPTVILDAFSDGTPMDI